MCTRNAHRDSTYERRFGLCVSFVDSGYRDERASQREYHVPERDDPLIFLLTPTFSYFGDGYSEAQMIYQFPLPPLVLFSMLKSDVTTLTKWASSLGGSDFPSPNATFFNFTASHDGLCTKIAASFYLMSSEGIGLRPAQQLLSEEEIELLCETVQSHGGKVSYRALPPIEKDGQVIEQKAPYELNITYFDAITDPEVTTSQPDVAVARFSITL